MVSLVFTKPIARRLNFSRFTPNGFKLYSTKVSKPLRILFCGSDEFSIASLQAIHAAHQRNPDFIKSIDVFCRPGKRAGRSLKKIREVPIKAVAQELGLTLHERDTFTGWPLPKPENEPINLIVAVSFGLFVPVRILEAAEYGGLNVHPSLLPDYRGPAPLQRMLIKKSKGCGITLQTLHTKYFDHGKILAQQWFPLEPNIMTYQKLFDIVTPKAAKLLVDGLRSRLFVPPLEEDATWQHKLPEKLSHASKITPADKRIFWQMKSAATDIPARQRALGRLWTSVLINPDTPKRLVFEDSETVNRPTELIDRSPEKGKARTDLLLGIGSSVHFFVEDQELRQPVFYIEDGPAVIFRTPFKAIRVQRITIEGQGTKDASKAMASLRLEDAWRVRRLPRKGLPRTGLSGTCIFEALPKTTDVEGSGSKVASAEPPAARSLVEGSGEELLEEIPSQEPSKEENVETK
ncbi:formyl transferase [Leptodontidium sp. 2 PMI_412]|nr:formyl transferase [Leptodontidium sp. 2 PMI_412]